MIYFQSPKILWTLFDNFVIVCGQGFLEAMLDPQMKNMIGASQAQVGIAFLLLGGSYLVTSVAAGFVSLTYYIHGVVRIFNYVILFCRFVTEFSIQL